MKYIFTILSMLFVGSIGYSQCDIRIKMKNYDNDTLILGYYLGEKTLAKDTLIGNRGKFSYKNEESLKPGVYMLLARPDNSFVQVLVNEEDQKFDIIWDVNNKSGASFKGSKDNEAFNDYIEYLTEKREELAKLNEAKKSLSEMGKDTTVILDKIDQLDKDVIDHQKDIIAKMPTSITAAYLKSNFQPEMKEYEGTKEEVRQQQYEYYKKHFFDNIDLGNPALIRTPFLHGKINTYMENLTPPVADSIIESIDYLLEKMKPAEDTYQYYLSHFVNTYAVKPIVGMDAVYVYLVDNYYSKGKAPWATEETLERLKKDANNIRGSLIGKTFPDITTYLADETPVRIKDIQADYTIVLFWKHTCGHCKTSMPHIVDFARDFKDRGVKVVTVCTEARDKAKKCAEYVDEHEFTGLTNTYDQYQRFRRKLYINTTPKLFILDKNKEIILKDIDAKKLGEVMEAVIKDRAGK